MVILTQVKLCEVFDWLESVKAHYFFVIPVMNYEAVAEMQIRLETKLWKLLSNYGIISVRHFVPKLVAAWIGRVDRPMAQPNDTIRVLIKE